MATNIIYIHDLPYPPRIQLCRILDADRRWEELGGMHMNYDVTTLTLIGQAIHREKSPTSELLNKYSERNGTIKKLFIMLAKMDHQRAMSVLQPYVDKKYHGLLRNENTMSTALNCAKKGDIPRPTLSQLSVSSNESSSQWSQSISHKDSSSAVFSCEYKDLPPVNKSKFSDYFVNLNKDYSSVSLESKMNSLNLPQSQSKIAVSRKSPDLSKFKKSCCNCKDESVSDNCVSEKIKNVKKHSVQEVTVTEKQQKHPSHLPYAVNINPQDDSLPDIMHIPYEDICKATNNFNKELVLGRGGFGTVYKGEWKGTSVAIKRLTPRENSDGPSQQLVSIKQSLNELNILKCCRFDHILPLYAVSLDGTHPCLIYQLMVNGSLEDRLLCKGKTLPLTWSQRSHIAECTTKGLNYLHTTPGKPLVHGDIKSANILLDANMNAKIGDFGLTREGPGCEDTHVKVSSVHGTECYLPPEYLRQRLLSPQVDIYSYGIVLLEIATGLRPFDPKRGEAKRLVDYINLMNDSGRLESLRDTKAGEEDMIWFRELIQIGQKCSSREKRKRPPLQEVLKQFEKVNKERSMMDKIRRLSSDRGNSAKPLKLPEGSLSPIEIQLFYDLQKDGVSGMPANKFSTSPHNNLLSNGIREIPEEMKSASYGTKSNDFSSESSDSRDTCDCSEYGQCNSQSERNLPPTNQSTTDDKCPFVGKPPLPLITKLQLQVSEFCNKADSIDSQYKGDTSNSNITCSD